MEDLDNPPSSGRRLFWVILILVIAVHFSARKLPPFGLSPEAIEEAANREAKKKPIEIEKWTDSEKAVVQTSKAPEKPELKDKEAKYAGEFRNRVEKEMQSELKGRFHEGAPPQPPEGEKSILPKAPEAEDGESPPSGISRLHLKDLMPFGASPNALPDDIAKGGETLLSTDPVMYASFVNRITDEIHPAWDRFAREAVYGYRGEKQLRPSTYVTRLGVLLNADGEVTQIQIIQSCGIDELDEAPKKAFWYTRNFPNPPKQMLKEDGFIRLVYEFHFELRNSAFNVVPLNI